MFQTTIEIKLIMWG